MSKIHHTTWMPLSADLLNYDMMEGNGHRLILKTGPILLRGCPLLKVIFEYRMCPLLRDLSSFGVSFIRGSTVTSICYGILQRVGKCRVRGFFPHQPV